MKNISDVLSLVLVSLILVSTFPGFAYGQGDVISSASELDYPPFSIVNPDGSAGGFSVELLTAALESQGYSVTFYVAPWEQIKHDLADGKIDVLPLVGKTPERELLYDFTKPYATFYGAIFVRNDESGIKDVRDLFDKEVIVMKGDNAEEYAIRENISQHIITTDSIESAFRMLSEGKHDAVVVHAYVGERLLKNTGIKNVVQLEKRLDNFKQDFTFAVKKGDKELLDMLSKGLDAVMNDGTYDMLHKRWFVENSILKQNYMQFFAPFGLIIIVVIGAYLYTIKKHQPEKATKKRIIRK